MSSPNTPATYYIDSHSAKGKCVSERKAIEKHCKPEPPQSEHEEKYKPRKRKGGLTGKLSEAADKLDSLGKYTAGYKRDKGSRTATDGNAWMEDHCSGLWITPTDLADPEFKSKFGTMLEQVKSNNLGMMKEALFELKDLAVEIAGEAAANKVFWFTVRTVVKGVVGAVGVETGVVPWAMGAWTAADLASTAAELAKLAGPQGKAALDAILDLKNIEDKADKIFEDYKSNPHKAQADAMSLMALLDPCTRARKCMLVSYKNTVSGKWKINADGEEDEDDEGEGTLQSFKKAAAQARHGQGCCPGQTGHHVLPHSMVKDAGCASYSKKEAPTICLEGTKNGFEHGSHGLAHKNLSKAMEQYRNENANTNTIPYAKAKELGIEAVRKAGAFQCDPDCLAAQLDEHYKGCAGKDLKAVAGTGGGGSPVPAAPPPDATPNIGK